MPSIPDFDVDEILGALKAMGDKYAEGSRERDVVELAQIALIFPRHIRREDEFRRYYARMFDPSHEIEVSHDFATREEAEKWLAHGEAQDATRVRIAGAGFTVVQLSGRLAFVNAPLPGEWKEDDGETEDT